MNCYRSIHSCKRAHGGREQRSMQHQRISSFAALRAIG